MPSTHQRDSTHVTSDHRYDSIYIDRTHIELLHRGIPEIPKTTDWGASGALISSFRVDTMVVKDSIYVEKVHDVAVHDTVTVVRTDTITIPVPVKPPPVMSLAPNGVYGERVPSGRERGPIPRVYKNCTLGFWILLLGMILSIALRLYFRR